MSQSYISTSDAPGMKVKKELGHYFQKILALNLVKI